jgi:hypothetical protein
MLNAALALCAIGMGWRLAGEWRRGNERYARLAELSGGSASVAVPPDPVRRSRIGRSEVVAKNLFTPTRNNEIAPRASSSPDARPPVVFGTMRLGENYEALMAEAGQAQSRRFRRVKTGEQFGPFTVVEIRDEAVVLELDGEKTTLNVYQSANSVARAEARSAPGAAANAPVVETAGSPAGGSAAAPAASAPESSAVPPTVPTAAPGVDPYLKMTIEGNRRRYERTTPFGPQVWYEEIQ